MNEFTKDLPEEQYKYRDAEIPADDVQRIKLPDDQPEIFEETQMMDHPWIWVVLGVMTVVTLVPLILTLQSLWAFLIPSAFLVLVLSMISALKLYTRIDDDGIHYRMMPFHLKEKTIPWEEIDSVRVRKYSPILEYGGYGIRMGRNGMAYNVRGNQGIQIVKKNGRRILLGTQKSDDVIKLLEGRPLIV